MAKYLLQYDTMTEFENKESANERVISIFPGIAYVSPTVTQDEPAVAAKGINGNYGYEVFFNNGGDPGPQ